MEVNVDFLPYMEVNVGKEKKGKTWRNEVDTITVKIATSKIHISILKKNFTILLRTFLHNFLRGITYQKLIFYGRISLRTLY